MKDLRSIRLIPLPAVLASLVAMGCVADGSGTGDQAGGDEAPDSTTWSFPGLAPGVLAPDADSAVVVARVLDSEGAPVEGATVGLGLVRLHGETRTEAVTGTTGVARLALDTAGVGGVVFHTTEALNQEERTTRFLLLERGGVTRVTVRLVAEDGSGARSVLFGERVGYEARSRGRSARFGRALRWAIQATGEVRAASRNRAARAFEADAIPIVDSMRSALEDETDPEVRALLWTGLLNAARVGERPVPQETAQRALGELDSPRAWAWWLMAAAPRVVEYAAAGAAGAFEDGEVVDSLWAEGTRYASAFVQRVANEHPDPYVRRGVLLTAMDWSGQDGRRLEALGYHDRLTAEHPGTREAEDAEWLRRRFGMPGEPAPDVPFAPLDTAALPFHPTDLGARAVLVDFWATWCVPCVEEMPTLHRAHERWSDRGFEIVSVSYDDTRDDVRRFRRVWPMPWRHAFEGRGAAAHGEVWKGYAIGGLPHTVLLDDRGRIVALDDELKGERLEQTLRRVLSEEDRSRP